MYLENNLHNWSLVFNSALVGFAFVIGGAISFFIVSSIHEKIKGSAYPPDGQVDWSVVKTIWFYAWALNLSFISAYYLTVGRADLSGFFKWFLSSFIALGDFDVLKLGQDPILAWAAVWAFIAAVCLGFSKNPRDERVSVLSVSALFLIMLYITLSIFGLKPAFFPSNYAGGVIIVFGTVLCYCKTIQVLDNYLAPPSLNARDNIVLPSVLVMMHAGLIVVCITPNQYNTAYFVMQSFFACHHYMIGIVLGCLIAWLSRFMQDFISLAQHKNSFGYTLWLKTTSVLNKLSNWLSRFMQDFISLAQHKNSFGYKLWLKSTSVLNKLTNMRGHLLLGGIVEKKDIRVSSSRSR